MILVPGITTSIPSSSYYSGPRRKAAINCLIDRYYSVLVVRNKVEKGIFLVRTIPVTIEKAGLTLTIQASTNSY
jgi:hypothetical protein